MDTQDSFPSVASPILFVEDDEATREVFQDLIEAETSYRTLPMRSGEETLRRLAEVRLARPRLLLLDYQLSGMNAIDLYDRLHATEELRDVPAIVVTAATLTQEEQEAIAARHIDLCWKPFEVQDLLDCIERALHPPPSHG
jgi:CheY-like chemotaxis protein